MKLRSIDLIVEDVKAAAAVLIDVFGATTIVLEPEFAELQFDDFSIMLSRSAMVPMSKAQGIILHLQVDDPADWEQLVPKRGGRVLQSLTTTPWGTTSVLCQGPEGVIIDLYADATE